VTTHTILSSNSLFHMLQVNHNCHETRSFVETILVQELYLIEWMMQFELRGLT